MNEVEEVKARLDIVDVIGQYVQLQKAGRTFKAPCPFHQEKTPSFIVSPDRQSWHCFGACGTGGDVISFVMKKDGLEFRDALRVLAERAGVRLQEHHRSQEEDRQRERLYAANEAAARRYQDLLLNADSGRPAREYLEKRGLSAEAIREFQLGHSPAAWEGLRQHLHQAGYTDNELSAAGLLIEGNAQPGNAGLHDRFRNRLMFPIWDGKGRIIGFGARALDDSMPKYLNTSQTALFDKGGMLYALSKAQEGIRREGRAVIVEGYMDVIAAHQHGFTNVVASMGTSLTERQVRLLKRLTGEIVLALDADAAGNEAAVRGHDVVREALAESDRAVPVVSWRGLVAYRETVSVELKVAVLPADRDPDDVVRADPELWRSLVEGAQPVLDFRLQAAAAAHELSDPRGRSQMVQEFLPLLSAVTDPVVRAHYLQRLSRLSQTSEQELGLLLRRAQAPKPAQRPGAAAPPASAAKGDAREEYLLALLLQYPQLRAEGLAVPAELLLETQNRQILAAWSECEELEAVKEAVPAEIGEQVQRLSLRALPPFETKEAREALADCVRRLEHRQLEAEKQAMAALLAEREEELGVAVVEEASGSEADDEQTKEVADLVLRDMETGIKLHGRQSTDGEPAVETRING